jgi:hypothetical protein
MKEPAWAIVKWEEPKTFLSFLNRVTVIEKWWANGMVRYVQYPDGTMELLTAYQYEEPPFIMFKSV